tara:strand:+ start:1197 stop:1559 length:363 start_codon:yes stop_codon:yes gene_type:complete
MRLRNKHDRDPEWDKEQHSMRENWKKWVELQVSLGYPNVDKLCLEKQDLIMDEGLETNYPTQEEIIAFNRKENSDKRVKRMHFLQQQIAAEGRLDGYVLEGHKEELKRLEEEHGRLNKIN